LNDKSYMIPPEVDKTARIASGVSIGKNTVIGPYAIIEEGVTLGVGCKVLAHSIVKQNVTLGDGVEVGHFSVIGGDPQYLGFDRSVGSKVLIGDRTRIGEGVTIHRSIEKDGVTEIGEDCFLMGNSHVAHDCLINNQVVLANGALLGGHVSIGSETFIGGGAAIHQFVRIGSGAMVGGLAEVSLDIPPQVLVSGRNQISGLNLVGLKRRKVTREELAELKGCFRKISTYTNLKKGAQDILHGMECPQYSIALEFVEFFDSGTRGFARLFKKP